MEEREIIIVFAKEYRNYIGAFGKKSKEDYILNVSKIIKDKFKTKFLIPNKIQSFLLNYEIKKLLDKAINIKNQKYRRIVYLNSNLSKTTVLNTIDFINSEYHPIKFKYCVIESKDLDPEDIENIPELDRIQNTKDI